MNPNLRREEWISDISPAISKPQFVSLDKGPNLAQFEVPNWKRQGASPAEIDAHYFHAPRRIDVDASPVQLKALFDRLHAQWSELGSAEPYWSVLTHEDYKRANLNDRRRAEFYATGYQHAQLVDLMCERTATRIQRGVCVELGCGVGRITQHLAHMFERVIAIDISEGNLAECRTMAEAEGLSNIETVLLKSVSDLKDVPDFDFLFSLIVLQHDPPPVQKYILDLLMGKISRGGGLLVQTQTFDPDYQFDLDSYLKSSPAADMEMHSFPMHHFMTLTEKHHFTVREVLTDNITGRFGSHTFFASAEALPGAHFHIDEPVPRPLQALSDDLKDELKLLTSQLQDDRARTQMSVSLSQDIRVSQTLWQRFNSYLNSIRFLTRTRRRVELLERNIALLCEATQAATSLTSETGAQLRESLRNNLSRLDDYQSQTDAAFAAYRESARSRLGDEVAAIEKKLAGQAKVISGQAEALRHERATRQKSFGAFDRRLSSLQARQSDAPAADNTTEGAQEMPGLQSLLESFYFLLEERYRGSRDEIKNRLSVYRKDFESTRQKLKCIGPVIDLGCGRGELLEMLQEQGFQVIGVDQNDIQLDAARQKGLPVLNANAIDYLKTLDDESLLAVSGIHIAEHLPFPVLVSLMQEIARVLKKGGLLVFETPNPKNLIVGANTFHFDPTHVRPLPPEVLEILFETCGFTDIEVRPLHPSDTLFGMLEHKRLDPHIAQLLFGPQDYAVLGTRG